MILQRINMAVPNSRKIYAPSQLAPVKVAYREFVTKYADHSRPVLVSLEPDMVSNPQRVTAYSFGLSGWFIVR